MGSSSWAQVPFQGSLEEAYPCSKEIVSRVVRDAGMEMAHVAGKDPSVNGVRLHVTFVGIR